VTHFEPIARLVWAAVNRKTVALIFLGIGILMNLIIVIQGDEDVALPLIAIGFLCVAVVALLFERRRY
jgi:hypothetical protein